MKTCRCYEAFIEEDDGRNDQHSKRLERIEGSDTHDCLYIENRNKLIPLAEAAANEEFPTEVEQDGRPSRAKHSPEWIHSFFAHMDRLVRVARAAGVKNL